MDKQEQICKETAKKILKDFYLDVLSLGVAKYKSVESAKSIISEGAFLFLIGEIRSIAIQYGVNLSELLQK